MRMWMVDPKTMCRVHLLGEHHELHMFAGDINRKQSVTGYIENNLLEPRSIKKRHDQLVREMLRRGYEHNTPLDQPDISYLPIDERRARIDVVAAENELRKRCVLCPTSDETFADCQKCWQYHDKFHGKCD